MENKDRIASPYTKFDNDRAKNKKALMDELIKMKEVLSTEAAQNSAIVKKNKDSNN